MTTTDTNYTVVSRHNTSEGVVLWVRCNRCAALRMHLLPAIGGDVALTAGHHEDTCPTCGE